MPTVWHKGKIVRIVDEGPLTKRYWMECDVQALDFTPGQFITCDLPIHEKRNKRWRSYSIANLPHEEGLLELCIVQLEGGAASDYFFSEVEIGSTLTFRGPAGVFTQPPSDREVVMVCTGTGVAPFRSMLLQRQTDHDFPSPIHLIFGTREEDGILYREELEKLAEEQPNFRYDITLSRSPEWDGYKGYVHQIYEEHYQTVTQDRLFLLCGWSMMVDDAAARLLDMGYDRKQIRFELYG